MGKVRMTGGGMTNAGSDDCTLLRSSVPMGAKAITADSNDEAVEGTLDIGRADASSYDVLEGASFIDYGYESDGTTVLHLIDGAMPDNGSVYAELNCGEYYAVPMGYHNGVGDVYAKDLASQTGGATAEDRYVLSGKTYWKDGVKRTGAMTVSSVVSFSVAAEGTNELLARWTNPAKGPYSGFIICAKTGGYPTNIHDNRKYTGIGGYDRPGGPNVAVLEGLSSGVLYYCRIWTYLTCSAGDQYSEYAQASATTTAHGQRVFTSSGSFTVPEGILYLKIHCTGGGGCGGAAYDRSDYDGAGGAGGYTKYVYVGVDSLDLSNGETLSVVVGVGGRQSSYVGTLRPDTGAGTYYGGKSSVTNSNSYELCSAAGGSCGHAPAESSTEVARLGGFGGSGGGAGCYTDRDNDATAQDAGRGGQDGSAGYTYHWGGSTTGEIGGKNAGAGQNSSTRAFGETQGTLYSGGGGGGGRYPAAGGAGGGGKGGWGTGNQNASAPGSAGTGGGGGGGTRIDDYTSTHSKGGSGNVIIRW